MGLEGIVLKRKDSPASLRPAHFDCDCPSSVQRVRARRAGGVAAQIADHRVLERSYPLVESQWAEQSDELASVMFQSEIAPYQSL
jgi:hypothetical protein